MADNINNEKPTAAGTEVLKAAAMDEVEPAISPATSAPLGEKHNLTPEMQQKIAAMYGKKAEDDNIAPARDVEYIVDKIQNMTEEEAIQILTEATEYHNNDPSKFT